MELVKKLDRSRFEPMIACFQQDGRLSEELPDELHSVAAFPLAGGFFNLTALRQASRFHRFLRRMRVQVVQCFDFYTNMFAIPVARLAGVPVILGSRREEALTKTWKQQMAERWCYRLATGVVANAEAIKDQLVRRDGLQAERIWVIRNGLDLGRFDRQGGSSLEKCVPNGLGVTVAVVANLRPEKGHLLFLEAAQLLAKQNPYVRFQIVGDGPMRKTIETRIRELGLTERVSLLGHVYNVPELLRSVDILVLPSLHNEGFPNAVMEAMAAALPVVATDTGGVRELVIDGLTGYVVPPGDAAALAERISWYCKDADLRRKMGEAGRSRVAAELTVDKMARKFEALYLALLHGTAGSTMERV